MEKHTCPVCQKQFSKKVYKKVQAVYCCQSCAYKGRTLGITKRVIIKPYNINRQVSDWRKKVCIICEVDYIATKRNQNHCSQTCYAVTKKLRMVGELNWSYKDGQSYFKRGYRGNDWETIRLEIYKRDGFTCQKCGVKCESKKNYTTTDNIIQCHHIEKYNGENNNNANLVTLCLKCHLAEHAA
jgi:5-methylcytosine-specific restriction endonuclease McrA